MQSKTEIKIEPGHGPYAVKRTFFVPGVMSRAGHTKRSAGENEIMTDVFIAKLRSSLERACQAQNISIIMQGRREIQSMRHDTVITNIESLAADSLSLDDEWEFRRLLELYEKLDQGLLKRLVARGMASNNIEVREAAEDFQNKT